MAGQRLTRHLEYRDWNGAIRRLRRLGPRHPEIRYVDNGRRLTVTMLDTRFEIRAPQKDDIILLRTEICFTGRDNRPYRARWHETAGAFHIRPSRP